MTRTRKTTLLVTSAAVGAATLLASITSPAGAAEGATARYHLTKAWPTHDDATPFTSIALAESGGKSAGRVEFEWKVEEGES
jgi:hypothetical protein